jgi:ubiquinone biosynthesis protein COQ9
MTDAASETHSVHHLTRDRLLKAILPHAAFDGWSRASFEQACADCQIEPGQARLACPRAELDLIAAWSRQLDETAAKSIAALDLPNLKIRDRVRLSVIARLEAIGDNGEAAHRARARLLLPDASAEGPQLIWASADMIWRAIGDTSTDVNFYSKRTILSGVIASTLAVWLNESGAGKPDARAFLDRRIQNVMDFEKTKAQVRKLTADLPDLGEMLGKIRYGMGPRS